MSDFPTQGDTPEGRNWQVVEVTKVTHVNIYFDRIRYGLTREEAEQKAGENEEWVAVQMPHSGE